MGLEITKPRIPPRILNTSSFEFIFQKNFVKMISNWTDNKIKEVKKSNDSLSVFISA